MFRSLLRQLVSQWPDYLSSKLVDRDSPTHKLVVESIPQLLQSWTPSPAARFKFQGSDGQGRLTTAPWFAVFHREVTETAQDGYYIVYLLSEDLDRLVLEIGFGYTQFENTFQQRKRINQAVDSAVIKMRQACDSMITSSVPESIRQKINLEPVNLTTKSDSLHAGYERCGIFNITYRLNALPADEAIKEDYLAFYRLYCAMADSVLLPNPADYAVEEGHLPEDASNDPEFTSFEPKNPIKSRNPGFKSNSTGRRYSKKAAKVGKLGEELVFEHQREILKNIGRADLAQKVIWHLQESKDRTPGWDITSFDNDGNLKRIEVKSSESNIYSVNLTPNEWGMAKKHQDSYFILIVENIFSKNPVITEMQNPAKYVHDGVLEIKSSEYELSLRSSSNPKSS